MIDVELKFLLYAGGVFADCSTAGLVKAAIDRGMVLLRNTGNRV